MPADPATILDALGLLRLPRGADADAEVTLSPGRVDGHNADLDAILVALRPLLLDGGEVPSLPREAWAFLAAACASNRLHARTADADPPLADWQAEHDAYRAIPDPAAVERVAREMSEPGTGGEWRR